MKFEDYRTFYHYARTVDAVASEDFNRFYELRTKLFHKEGNHYQADQMRIEWWFMEEKRPYYNVWPTIAKSFLKLDLDHVPVSALVFPTRTLALRFPDELKLLAFHDKGREWWVKSVLIARSFEREALEAAGVPVTETYCQDIIAYIDIGETEPGTPGTGCPMNVFRRFRIDQGGSVADAMRMNGNPLASFQEGVTLPRTLLDDVFRIIAACGLLANDQDVVIPDVMEKHKAKYEETRDPGLVVKAVRNGKVGWNVGEQVEKRAAVSPHFRNPHFAVYWTGPGGERKEVKFRTGPSKGVITVKRDDVKRVPTGYLDAVNQ